MRIIDKLYRKISSPEKWMSSAKRITAIDILPEPSISVGIDPSHHFLNIVFTSGYTGSGHIRIFSLDGHEIYNRNLKQDVGKNNFDIDVRSFKEGVYIVETLRSTSSATSETTYNKIEISEKITC